MWVVSLTLWPLYCWEKSPLLSAKIDAKYGIQPVQIGEERALSFLRGIEPLYFSCPARSWVTVLTELTRFCNCRGQLACTGQDDTWIQGLKDVVRQNAWRSLVCRLSACVTFIFLYELQSVRYKGLEFLEWLSDCWLQMKRAAEVCQFILSLM